MIESILQLIHQGQTFLVASHENPDGDAIGSTLALSGILREMGKDVVAYNRHHAPREYAFLPGCATIVSELNDAALFEAGQRTCVVRAVGGQYRCFNGFRAVGLSDDNLSVLMIKGRAIYRARLTGARGGVPTVLRSGASPSAAWLAATP